ncbi:unnamed protein product [Macrosiphum euphorbiae]|uniref:Integrase catalytic domain-containing protein n=1 Tax=Macrosiphum euphorbiae TaxID=13131 RepID=A0AAV0X9D5_9HEMI|nr:unnamed protein product [Macrosiphum euphorbiae]
MTKFIETRGIPDRIISDRGSCFTSRPFEQFCAVHNIEHILNSTRHPQANGQVERANRTIVTLLSMSTEDQRRWDAKVNEVERMLNSAENKTTKKTPFAALHGYQPRFHQGILGSLSQNKNDWREPTEVQGEASDNIREGQKAMVQVFNRKHIPGVSLDLGEMVVMLKAPTTGQPTKLQAKYREKPLQVIQKLPGDTYRVAEVTPEGQTSYATTAHISQLKSWKILDQEDETDELSVPDSFEGTPTGDGEAGERPTIDDQEGSKIPEPITPATENPVVVRGQRERKAPGYLRDYVAK